MAGNFKVDFKKLGKKAKGTTKGKSSTTKGKADAEAPAAKNAAKGGKEGYDDSNRFVLFVNEKDGNDARPDYTGKVTIVLDRDVVAGEPIELRLAAWLTDSPKIGQYLSGRVSEPQEKK